MSAQEERERIEREHGSLSPEMIMAERNHTIGVFKDGKLIAADADVYKRCHWCKRFIGAEGMATVREPNTFYCPLCYDKGLQMEYEAMGLE